MDVVPEMEMDDGGEDCILAATPPPPIAVAVGCGSCGGRSAVGGGGAGAWGRDGVGGGGCGLLFVRFAEVIARLQVLLFFTVVFFLIRSGSSSSLSSISRPLRQWCHG